MRKYIAAKIPSASISQSQLWKSWHEGFQSQSEYFTVITFLINGTKTYRAPLYFSEQQQTLPRECSSYRIKNKSHLL